MNQGKIVIIRAFGGEPLVRRVWEVSQKTVFACSERCFQGLMAGIPKPLPIGFPMQDVFEYDGAVLDDLLKYWQTDSSVWDRATPWLGDVEDS